MFGAQKMVRTKGIPQTADCLLEYFEETVDQYSATDKSIYLLGDININILKSKTCNYAQQF